MKQQGFSLIELLVTVAIIGIIASIALPSYQSQMRKGPRGEAMGTLLDMMRVQEDYFANNYSYTTDLTELNYSDPHVISGGDYQISASQCDDGSALTSCIKLTANAQGAQASDGNLTLNSRGDKTHNGNNKWVK